MRLSSSVGVLPVPGTSLGVTRPVLAAARTSKDLKPPGFMERWRHPDSKQYFVLDRANNSSREIQSATPRSITLSRDRRGGPHLDSPLG